VKLHLGYLEMHDLLGDKGRFSRGICEAWKMKELVILVQMYVAILEVRAAVFEADDYIREF
jgi:hypothetical protein